MNDVGMHQQTAFGITRLTSQHKSIRQLRRQQGTAELHGNKIWKSSYVLMDYLSECPIEPGSRVLELGCGWGLSGIFCAKHFDADVVSLDADESVFPFLELHAEVNGIEAQTYCQRFEKVTKADLSHFDVIIGADICFWDEMSIPLTQLIKRALAADVGRIIITDPGRQPFRDMAEEFSNRDANVIYTDWSVPEPHNIWGLVLDI